MKKQEKNQKMTKEVQEVYDALVRSGFFRMGWSAPRTLEETVQFFKALAGDVHNQWIRAIELNVVPPEDVSPGEGFLFTAKMIEEHITKMRNNTAKTIHTLEK